MPVCKRCDKNKEPMEECLAGFFCEDCYEDYLDGIIKDAEGDTHDKSVIICPFCMYRHRGKKDYVISSGFIDCAKCGNEYCYCWQTGPTYTTFKL